MKTIYWRNLTTKSSDLNPVKSTEPMAFDSNDYETDLKQSKENLKGRKFVSLSKSKFDTYGERIN